MRMFKKVLAGFVAAAMVATMAGCGSSNSSTDNGSDKAAAEATTEDTDSKNKNVYVADVYQSLTLRSEASADSDAITDLEPMTHLEVLEFTAGTNYAYVEVLSGEKKSYKGYVNSDYITKLGEPTVRIGTEE